MDIKIKETGEVQTLVLIDAKTGCDWLSDLVAGCDDFAEYDQDAGHYIMPLETFEWWFDHVAERQALEDLRAESIEEFGQDCVDKCFDDAGSVDFNDEPAHYSAALRSLRV